MARTIKRRGAIWVWVGGCRLDATGLGSHVAVVHVTPAGQSRVMTHQLRQHDRRPGVNPA